MDDKNPFLLVMTQHLEILLQSAVPCRLTRSVAPAILGLSTPEACTCDFRAAVYLLTCCSC